MLAPLAFYLVLTLTACSMILMVCWAGDTARTTTKTTRSHPADSGLGLAVHFPPARGSHIVFRSSPQQEGRRSGQRVA
jgi:hypothetical protein